MAALVLLLFPLMAIPVLYLSLKWKYLDKRGQGLGAWEQRYIMLSPLPLMLAFIVSIMSTVRSILSQAAAGGQQAGGAGAWLSGAVSATVFALGVWLAVRASARGQRQKAMLLGLASLIAGFPFLVVAGYALFS